MEENNHDYSITLQENAFIDKGNGYIDFPAGLTITDDTEQRNGTKYDIKSMEISEYKGHLTANHSMDIQEIIGKVKGLKKVGNKVIIEGIQFAIEENALALYAYNMLKAKYLTDFSIETFGPWPGEDGIYYNARLIGLSAVVIGNNRSARVNDFDNIVLNSLEEAKKKGLDTKHIEKLCYNKESVINNSSLQMEDKKPEGEATVPQTPTTEQIGKIVENAVAPFAEKIKELETKIFDNSAKVPEFRADAKKVSVELNSMNYKERHAKQINYAWDMLKGSSDAANKLADVNKFHLEKLQEAGIVGNSITISDMGNFVISPELLSDIQGYRSDFTPLISKLDYRETLSTQMAWLKRSGDIDMQEVEMEADGADGELKPISEYGASIQTSNLHELAAVTPVCNAATRFLAVDLLADVAAGYRTDFDRKRAQLFIARLQQAVNSTGNVVTYTTTSDVNALKSWVDTIATVSEEIMNGVFILNNKSRWELVKRAIGSGIAGDVLGIVRSGDLSPILGAPAIVVPNELMPTLNTAQTKSFTVGGTSVTINRAVFYTDLSVFTGRTSGGLQYDLSTEAAYEEGATVKSAFQRNELVLRGSFFRGGAIKDTSKVVALGAPGVS